MTLLRDGVSLRDARVEDLPDIADLRQGVGWATHAWALRLALDPSNGRFLVAESDGRLVAMGSAVSYRTLGIIGNMVVADGHRRRGLGSAILGELLADLDERGIRTTDLYATAGGRPLYERHGFRSTGGNTMLTLPRDAEWAADPAVTVETAAPADLAAIAAFDAARAGGDRSAVLRFVLGTPEWELLVARREGRLVGYAVLRPEGQRIGPWVADDQPAAGSLAAAAFGRRPAWSAATTNLGADNVAGTAWLSGLAAGAEAFDSRMRRGPEPASRPGTIYGNIVGALG